MRNTPQANTRPYTAFSALDPVTLDQVSRLTGTVTERRTSRSGPAGLSAGRSSISRGEVERPLLEPGEVRALPDEVQLVFVAGHRPLRARKLKYDRTAPFRRRAAIAAPDPAVADLPSPTPHPWAGRRGLGEDEAAPLPLFNEFAGAINDKKAAADAARTYGRVIEELAAQQVLLDQLQENSHD